jgi:hypothetical protein
MNPREFLAQFGLSFVGVTEQTGNNDGPYVEMFQRWTDGVAAHEPWCMAFAQFCVGNAAQQFGLISPLPASEHVLTVWNNSQHLVVFPPYVGCLALWQHPGTTNGHTGIVTGVDEQNGVFNTVEGNTSGGTGLNREGDGCYEKVRSMSGETNFVLLGFVDPFGGVV